MNRFACEKIFLKRLQGTIHTKFFSKSIQINQFPIKKNKLTVNSHAQLQLISHYSFVMIEEQVKKNNNIQLKKYQYKLTVAIIARNKKSLSLSESQNNNNNKYNTTQ